jgi:L-rhamnose isomerase
MNFEEENKRGFSPAMKVIVLTKNHKQEMYFSAQMIEQAKYKGQQIEKIIDEVWEIQKKFEK